MFIQRPVNNQGRSSRKKLHGFGVNDAWYVVSEKINGSTVKCPYYTKWVSMIERCYSDKYQSKQPSYIGCAVCDEWRLFSNFRVWMESQDWQGKQLDKDILKQGNKVYSPETCIFVEDNINKLLTNRRNHRGEYPLGVHKCNVSGKYISQCNVNSRRVRVGKFNTSDEAFVAYKEFKYGIIKQIAKQQTEPLKSALLNYKISEN